MKSQEMMACPMNATRKTVKMKLIMDAIIALPPNSRARRCAAATASSTVARIPPRSSAISPAAVVPPGEVTVSRRSAGCSPVSWARRALPVTVSTASARAMSRGIPRYTPASMRASMNAKT